MIGWRSLLGIAFGVAVILVAARAVLTRERLRTPGATSTASAASTLPVRSGARKPRQPTKPSESTPPPTPIPLDCAAAQGLAATVNDRPITVSQLCDRLRFVTGGTSPAAGRLVLEQLIEAELFIGALEERDIEVPEADINAELRNLAPSTLPGATPERTRTELRTAAYERVARRLLVSALGQLEPTASDLRAASPQAKAKATVEAWIARVPGNASNDATGKAYANATAGLESLKRGTEPQQEGLERLPPFDLTQGSGEPALEAAMFAPTGSHWQAPLRTRAGWVVARAVSIERVAPNDEDNDPRRAAIARIRQSEERRLLEELRTAATIVRYVQ